MIRNCPISQHDISNARTMFGPPQLAGVHGKTTWGKPEPVVEKCVAIPSDFVLQNKTIMLSADVFFGGWHCLPADSFSPD